MNKPDTLVVGAKYTYSWADIGVSVEVDRLSYEGIGEVSFWHDNGTGRKLLHFAKSNLLSTQTCSQLAKRLKDNLDVDWNTILTYVSSLSLQECRKGEAAVEIWPRENDRLEAEYLLDPVLYLNQPTVLFGDYGSCKSLLALMLGYVVQLPLQYNTLGFVTRGHESTKTLFLDYEDDQENFNRRWSALSRGFRVEATMSMLYHRMVRPLCDCVEEIHRLICENDIKFIMVDSLGPATRGNLNEAEPAIRYYEALRSLKTTSLTLAHCAKDALSTKRTIFGSVFFTNLARAVWECKADGEDPIIVSLKRTKANLSKKEATLGFSIAFDGNIIRIEKGDLKDSSLSGELPLAWQIQHKLSDEGALDIKQLADMLGKGEQLVRTTLGRMLKKGTVVKLPDHKWGMRSHETE